jgi:hypothetical protein
MATALSVRRPRQSREDKLHQEAAKLQRLTGGMLVVEHSAAFFAEDPGIRGYLIHGYSDPFNNSHPEWDHVQIDARKGDLRKQMVKELKRISRLYRKIARKVEGGEA